MLERGSGSIVNVAGINGLPAARCNSRLPCSSSRPCQPHELPCLGIWAPRSEGEFGFTGSCRNRPVAGGRRYCRIHGPQIGNGPGGGDDRHLGQYGRKCNEPPLESGRCRRSDCVSGLKPSFNVTGQNHVVDGIGERRLDHGHAQDRLLTPVSIAASTLARFSSGPLRHHGPKSLPCMATLVVLSKSNEWWSVEVESMVALTVGDSSVSHQQDWKAVVLAQFGWAGQRRHAVVPPCY